MLINPVKCQRKFLNIIASKSFRVPEVQAKKSSACRFNSCLCATATHPMEGWT